MPSEGWVKVIIKVPPAMCDQLDEAARQAGVTRSEYLRESVRQRWARDETSGSVSHSVQSDGDRRRQCYFADDTASDDFAR